MAHQVANLLDEWKAMMAAAASEDLEKLWELSNRLRDAQLFSYARELLRAIKLRTAGLATPRHADLHMFAIQQLAVTTYKDPQLPLDERFDLALHILSEADLSSTRNQETLGIAGAIRKRQWEIGGREERLLQSLAYYLRGYREGIADNGYTAINAAFVLDLLATHHASDETESVARNRRARADQIREDIVNAHASGARTTAPPQDKQQNWWTVATLVEAYLGLHRLPEAAATLQSFDRSHVAEWHLQATVTQWTSLVRCREGHHYRSAARWRFLQEQFPREAGTLDENSAKVGLALSGGGFRAALFHIGVLARLAELDLLRRVEVLSCVSGGSVLGAHYFLRLRRLLQTTPDADLTRDHYVKVVRDMIREFLDAVQTNIRTRAFADWSVNFRILAGRDGYTLTDRIGELLDEHFLRLDKNSKSPPLRIRDVQIQPLGCSAALPHFENWRRRGKVPLLILNSTALNTGHSWQFTPRWMGESRTNTSGEIDANATFTSVHFDEIRRDDGGDHSGGDRSDCGEPQQRQRVDVSFGKAVASSACVPVLFPPSRITNVYDNVTIALVDGAIHDNQGTASLLTEGCNVIIVSDGAGQIPTLQRPDIGPASVLGRANGILQERIREARYRELCSRQHAGTIRFSFLHLAKDLTSRPIDWKYRVHLPGELVGDSDDPANTPYGVSQTLQRLLLNVRTDLDSFSDTEGFALMNSGYQMARHYLGKDLPGLTQHPPEAAAPQEPWEFLCIHPRMDGKTPDAQIEQALRLASHSTFRYFRWRYETAAVFRGGIILIAVAVMALPVLILLCWAAWRFGWMPIGAMAIASVAVMTGLYLLLTRRKLLRTPLQTLISFFVCVFAWVPASLHMRFTERRNLRCWRLRAARDDAS